MEPKIPGTVNANDVNVSVPVSETGTGGDGGETGGDTGGTVVGGVVDDDTEKREGGEGLYLKFRVVGWLFMLIVGWV